MSLLKKFICDEAGLELVEYSVMAALIVAALFVVMLQIDDYVVQPKIIGKRVSLPGLFVLIGVATGTAIAGILGAYLAVPTIAAFRVIFLYVHGKVTEGAGCPPEADTARDPVLSSRTLMPPA